MNLIRICVLCITFCISVINSLKWESSECDFVNFRGVCVNCTLTKAWVTTKRKISEVRSPPDKPLSVQLYLFYNNGTKNTTKPDGIRIVIGHPFTTLSLEGYSISMDLTNHVSGERHVGFPYQFEVYFDVMHHDDRNIMVDIPLTHIFRLEEEPRPHFWLNRVLLLHVCSLPSMKSNERGNCHIPISVENIPSLTQLKSNKSEVVSQRCQATRESVPSNHPKLPPPSKIVLISLGGVAVVLCLLVVAIFSAWKNIRKNQSLNICGLELMFQCGDCERRPRNKRNSRDNSGTLCVHFPFEEDVDIIDGGISITHWESGSQIAQILGSNGIDWPASFASKSELNIDEQLGSLDSISREVANLALNGHLHGLREGENESFVQV